MPRTTRATRRRQRHPDNLANPVAIKRLLQELHDRVPNDLPKTDPAIEQMLIAIRHQETYGGSNSRRGRPSRYDRAQMRRVADALKALLQRETQGRISLRTFVDHYMRVLHFPADIVSALSAQSINLFEAEQLARLSSHSMMLSAAQAERLRVDLLKTHLISHESGARLRLRVNELLGKSNQVSMGQSEPVKQQSIDATMVFERDGEFEMPDPTHLFYDQLQHIGVLMRELNAELLSDELLEEILDLSDQLINALNKAHKRPRKINSFGI